MWALVRACHVVYHRAMPKMYTNATIYRTRTGTNIIMWGENHHYRRMSDRAMVRTAVSLAAEGAASRGSTLSQFSAGALRQETTDRGRYQLTIWAD